MKVDAQEAPPESGSAKQSPDGARFQQALQQVGPRRTTPGGAPPRGTTATPRTGGTPPSGAPGGFSVRAPASTARATGPVLATARGALASPENLGRTRQAMHSEAQRLGTVRGEAGAQVQERTEQRLTDLVARELARDFRAPPPPAPEARPPPGTPSPPERQQGADAPVTESRAMTQGSPGAASVEEVSPASRAEAALELIERIEVFVKSQRPALSLSLRGGLDATVEVERTGPREVALRIQGRRGPLPSEDVARLRDALEARGLRLRSLRAE